MGKTIRRTFRTHWLRSWQDMSGWWYSPNTTDLDDDQIICTGGLRALFTLPRVFRTAFKALSIRITVTTTPQSGPHWAKASLCQERTATGYHPRLRAGSGDDERLFPLAYFFSRIATECLSKAETSGPLDVWLSLEYKTLKTKRAR